MFLRIVRGLPGSGKSTYARAVAHDTGAVHCEADQYFQHGSEYRFDASQLGAAHADCQYRAMIAMRDGKPVVVSNTFVKLWELVPYLKVAGAHRIEVYEMHTQYGSVHNVPEDVIRRMQKSWQDITEDFRCEHNISSVTQVY